MSRLWFKRNWKRWLIICICMMFLLDHQFWHTIQFDGVTISLLIILSVFLALPNPQVIFPYIKRIKLWEAEVELKEEIKELGKEIEKAQAATVDKASTEPLQPSPSKSTPEISDRLPIDVEDVLVAAGKDPRAALLLLGTRIEDFFPNRGWVGINFLQAPLGTRPSLVERR